MAHVFITWIWSQLKFPNIISSFQVCSQHFIAHSTVTSLSLSDGDKVPLRPSSWSLGVDPTRRTRASCTLSPPWAQWPFALASDSTRVASDFPLSSLIPSSHSLMSSSSVAGWFRVSQSSWLCWSMAHMGLTRRPSSMTAPGTPSVSVGANMEGDGPCTLTGVSSTEGTA